MIFDEVGPLDTKGLSSTNPHGLALFALNHKPPEGQVSSLDSSILGAALTSRGSHTTTAPRQALLNSY